MLNKVILQGRLTKEPEVRYSQGNEPMAVARYTLAVDRKKKGEADFIPCVAFGKNGEFAEKWLTKGQMVVISGRLQVRNWEDNNGNKRVTTEVVVEEQNFCGEKKDKTLNEAMKPKEEFYPIDDSIEDPDLPF